VLARQAHIVKHGCRIEQLAVELQAASQAGQGPETVNAARMIEEQIRFGIPNELGDLPTQPAVGNFDAWFWLGFVAASSSRSASSS
jgi:hypothetical protein